MKNIKENVNLRKAIVLLNDDAIKLFSVKVTWEKITAFIASILKVCESLYQEVGQGENKLALAMQIWNHFDEQYKLIQALDNLIDLRKILGSVIGTVAEIWDAKILEAVIESILIPAMVSILFPKKE